MKLIVAVNSLGYIGKDNTLMWYCPSDLALFKKLTMGCKLLVGRKTFESLPPLKGRELIVVGKGYNTLEQALAKKPDWVIGGEAIYNATMHLVDEFHISVVRNWDVGDKRFDFREDLTNLWYKRILKKQPVPKIITHYFDL